MAKNSIPTYFTAPLNNRAAEKKVRSMPVSSVVRLARDVTLSGEFEVSAEARGLPVRPARNKDGSIRLNDKGERVESVVKEIRDFGNMVMDHIMDGWKVFDDQIKAAKPKQYAAALAEEKAAVVHLVTADTQAVADAKAARAKKLAEEKTAVVAEAEAIVSTVPVLTKAA